MRQTRLAGESADYGSAREELRLAEIELTHQREHVAGLRRRVAAGPGSSTTTCSRRAPVMRGR